jgi:alpha-tubulin suppressor-like RCC1 family protein
MTYIRRFGLPALFALSLIGGWASCSQSDKAGILLTVDSDTTVPKSPAITSLAVTVNETTKTYDVSAGLPGTLGIETSPGDKDVVVVGLTAAITPVARGTVTCSAAAGKVLDYSVTLYPLVDAGIPSDVGPSDTDGAPGPDGALEGDAPTSTGGATGGSGGAIASGGSTTTGGVTSAGGTTSAGGATGGASDAGGGASAFDAGSTTDAPQGTAGSSGGAGGATTAGGTVSGGGTTSSGGAAGGTVTSGGVTTSGGLSNSGGGGSATGGTSTGGAPSTGGTTGTTKLVATAVAAGWGHSCALISDGTIWCWGWNQHGQLGNGDKSVDGTTNVVSEVPVQVEGVTQAVAVATGDYHTCAVIKGGTVQCWGWNFRGQLGNGLSGMGVFSTVPTPVGQLSNASSVVAGENHTCALLSDGTVNCWGRNDSHQLATGDVTQRATPASVLTGSSTPTALTNVTALAATQNHTCAIQSTGALYCWGYDAWGQLGNGVSDSNGPAVAVRTGSILAVSVGVGYYHSCAVLTAGSPYNVQCWGSGSGGELGDGNTTYDSLTPVNAKTSAKAVAIALGYSHSCAVLVDGTVQCWGENTDGQLGSGSTSDQPTPVPGTVKGLSQVVGLSCGDLHTCAVVSGGKVYCWGSNNFGQLGCGSNGGDIATPTLVTGFGP